MFQKFIQKFMTFSPFLKVIASIIGLLGILGGGYAVGNISLFETTNNTTNNYINEEKKAPKESTTKLKKEKPSTISITEKTAITKPQSSTKKTVNTTLDLFTKKPLKNASQTTISFFIKKQGALDSKMMRIVTQSAKQSNLNATLIFNSNALSHFDNFLLPSTSFLQKTKIENYTDLYFICEITDLEAEKTPGRETYTSNIRVEGYFVNTKNSDIISFTYNTIKGAGFTKNDAIQNANDDLVDKIVNFVNSNLNSI